MRLGPRTLNAAGQFEFLIDDLPMHGYIGFSSDEDLILGRTAQSKVFMYTHLHFMIEYNGPHVSVVPSQQLECS